MSLEWLKLEWSNFACLEAMSSLSIRMTIDKSPLKGAWLGHVTHLKRDVMVNCDVNYVTARFTVGTPPPGTSTGRNTVHQLSSAHYQPLPAAVCRDEGSSFAVLLSELPATLLTVVCCDIFRL